MIRRSVQDVFRSMLLAFFFMASCARGLGQLYPVPNQTPAQSARVQQMLSRFSTPGRWEPEIKWMGRDSLFTLEQASSRGATARSILEIFKHAAFLNPPQGFEVQVSLMGIGQGPLDFHRDDVAATGSHPGAFRLGLDLFPGSAKQAGESGMHIIIDVNYISPTSNPGHSRGTQALKPVAMDSAGPILRGAPGGKRQIGAFHGFPLYRDRTIVLTGNRQPLYVPVSRGEYLRAMISDSQAKAQVSAAPYLRSALTSLQSALAAMNSEEKSGQAWIGCRGPGTLCAENDPLLPDATPLQRVNRKFFDPKQPADSVQLITIRMAENLDPYAQYLFQHIWDALDWNALSQLLSQTRVS